jgi:hypothetical protein
MSKIPSPTVPKDDPDRFLQCQDALHIAVQDLIGEAVAAGWNEAEAIAAVIETADAHMLMQIENSEVEAILDRLKKRP